MWKPIKDDNISMSALLLAIGLVTALVTVMVRLGACSTLPEAEPSYSKKLEIDIISYVAFHRSMAQVRAARAYFPDFPESWTDKPQVIVNWRIETRSGSSYSGKATGVLNPPYTFFIFSLEEDLEQELSKIHSEWVFMNEERRRVIREITELHVQIVHPTTGSVEATFTQKFDPDQRKPPAIGYD